MDMMRDAFDGMPSCKWRDRASPHRRACHLATLIKIYISISC